MSDYKPKIGDRVKVTKHYTYEGVVQRVDDKYFAINGGGFPGFSLLEKNLTVEKLPDPEPEWHFGHVVIDGRGSRYFFRAIVANLDKPWLDLHGKVTADADLCRPLTIVGVPVTPELTEDPQ